MCVEDKGVGYGLSFSQVFKHMCGIRGRATAVVFGQGRPSTLGAVSADYAYGDLESDRTERMVSVGISARVLDWALSRNLVFVKYANPFPDLTAAGSRLPTAAVPLHTHWRVPIARRLACFCGSA